MKTKKTGLIIGLKTIPVFSRGWSSLAVVLKQEWGQESKISEQNNLLNQTGDKSLYVTRSRRGRRNERAYYDNEVDAIYIKLGNQKPDGVVEISEAVNLDTTRMNIKTILSYELELDNKLIQKSV